MRPKAYSPAEIEVALAGLNNWQLNNNSISKEFSFKNFSQAFWFYGTGCLAGRKKDHHPDWKNSYNKVSISLTTHDAGGLTELDFKLAQTIDKILANGF